MMKYKEYNGGKNTPRIYYQWHNYSLYHRMDGSAYINRYYELEDESVTLQYVQNQQKITLFILDLI